MPIVHYPKTDEDVKGRPDANMRNFDFKSLPSVSIFEAFINGNFPASGLARHDTCNQAVRVQKGKLSLYIHDANGLEIEYRELEKGESFELPKGTVYHMISNPTAVLLIVSEPPWDKESLGKVYL